MQVLSPDHMSVSTPSGSVAYLNEYSGRHAARDADPHLGDIADVR